MKSYLPSKYNLFNNSYLVIGRTNITQKVLKIIFFSLDMLPHYIEISLDQFDSSEDDY